MTLDSLFSGFNLAMNGHIILTDGSKVIATNNNLYKGKTVSELQDVVILDGDYRQTAEYTGANSLFYFDPPYKPVNAVPSR